jgi:hypothetical protein
MAGSGPPCVHGGCWNNRLFVDQYDCHQQNPAGSGFFGKFRWGGVGQRIYVAGKDGQPGS